MNNPTLTQMIEALLSREGAQEFTVRINTFPRIASGYDPKEILNSADLHVIDAAYTTRLESALRALVPALDVLEEVATQSCEAFEHNRRAEEILAEFRSALEESKT